MYRTGYGLFKYTIMAFGLANTHSIFQNMMNEVLQEFLDQGVVVYLDDLFIYSSSQHEHEILVSKFLQQLQEEDWWNN